MQIIEQSKRGLRLVDDFKNEVFIEFPEEGQESTVFDDHLMRLVTFTSEQEVRDFAECISPRSPHHLEESTDMYFESYSVLTLEEWKERDSENKDED